MKRMKLFGHLLLTATLSSSLLLTGCGKDDLPNDIDIPSASPSTPSGMSDDEIRAALPKIMEGLEEIKEKLATLQLTAVSPDDEDDRPSTPNPKPTTKPATGSNPKPTPTPKPLLNLLRAAPKPIIKPKGKPISKKCWA